MWAAKHETIFFVAQCAESHYLFADEKNFGVKRSRRGIQVHQPAWIKLENIKRMIIITIEKCW